jgi:4-hydroxy-3-methylbut-2-enyl diphosphate reductase
LTAKIKLIVARELGFCMGVRRSIDMASSVRQQSDGNVTVLNELVHNRDVIDGLSKAGIGQTFDIGHVSPGKLILSAHGVPRKTLEHANALGLEVIDTTCPLVTKVHELVEKLIENDYHILVFGDPDHDEIRGIFGHGDSRMMTLIENDSELPATIPDRCALISQTTQNVDDFEKLSDVLRSKFPNIEIHNTICNPTRQRQEAAIELARQCEFVYVVGSTSSANSMRLAEITESICGHSILIESPDQIRTAQLEGVSVIGLTAGASSPDSLIASVIKRLCELFDVDLITYNPEFARIREKSGKQ